MKQIGFFALAGGIGFAVDVAVLYLALTFTLFGPFLGRALAIAAAMASTWWINRTFTFGRSGRTLVAEGTRYGGIGLGAAAINYLVYSVLLMTIPSLSPFLALVAASAFATGFSYFGYSRFVFGRAD